MPNILTIRIPTKASAKQLKSKPEEVVWDFGYTPRIVLYEGVLDTNRTITYMNAAGLRFGLASPVRKWIQIYADHYQQFLAGLIRSHFVSNEFALDAAMYRKLKPSLLVRFGYDLYELNKINTFDLLDEGSLTTVELIRKV